MLSQIRLSRSVQGLLRCPGCRARLEQTERKLLCTNPGCETAFPIVDGVPVLLDEAARLFSIEALQRQAKLARVLSKHGRRAGKAQRAFRLIPSISANVKGEQNLEAFAQFLLERSSHPISRCLRRADVLLPEGLRPAPDRQTWSARCRVSGLLLGAEERTHPDRPGTGPTLPGRAAGLRA